MIESEHKEIEVKQLSESPWNKRRNWNLTDLVESIRSRRERGHPGIIVPLHVRPIRGQTVGAGNGSYDTGRFEILAGHRRYRAAKKLKLDKVPAIVTPLEDEDAVEVVVIDNLQRENLHPLDEAEGYRELMTHGNRDAAEIAKRIGKSDSYVYQRVKLLDLQGDVQELFTKDEILLGHALQIARLQPGEQQTRALRYLKNPHEFGDWQASKHPTVKDLARWIESEFHLDLHAAPFQKQDAELVPEAGDCVHCPKRAGFQPLLFADVKKKDTCTDPDCFRRKIEAHIGKQLAGAEAAGAPLVRITVEHRAGKDGAKPMGAWTTIEAKGDHCRYVKKAIFVDGSTAGHLAEVCTNPKCAKHKLRLWGVASREPDAEDRAAKRSNVNLGFELRKAESQALMDAVLAASPGRPGVEDWRYLIAGMLATEDELYGDDQILKRHGAVSEPEADDKADERDVFERYAALIAPPAGLGEIYQLGVEFLLEATGSFMGPSLTPEGIAGHFGVDAGKLRKSVRRKFKREHPEWVDEGGEE